LHCFSSATFELYCGNCKSWQNIDFIVMIFAQVRVAISKKATRRTPPNP
jgi:hypothetical protein